MSHNVIPISTKCSKPAGEYCRLHRPKPDSQGFKNANDVFNVIEAEKEKRETLSSIKANATELIEEAFDDINVTRVLSSSIPANLIEHINISQLKLDHLSETQMKALQGYTGFAAGVCNSVLRGRDYQYYDEAPLWKEALSAPCDFVSREDLVDYLEVMDTVLATRQPERRIIYRGIPIYTSLHDEIGDSIGKKLNINDTEGLVEGLKEYYKVGKTFNYATYLSTTRSAHYAAKRTENAFNTKNTHYDEEPEIAGIMFEMKTNAGLDVTAAAKKRYAHEREVVLPRDTHFKVVGVYTRPETYDTISGYDKLRDPEEIQKAAYKKIAVVVQMVEVDKEGNEITHTRPSKPSIPIEKIIRS